MTGVASFGARLLRRLDPERAHKVAVSLLRWAPIGTAAPDDPRLAVSAFGLRFPNPVGLAAGFDKNAEVVGQALRLGFGFTEVGTLTPLPQAGNPRPRVFRLTQDHAIINRYGFNNDGHADAFGRLTRTAAGGLVGINIGANKNSADRATDYAAGIARFASVASYFALNVSSPNTPGLRDLQAATALDALLGRASEARDRAAEHTGRKPLLLKIAPDVDLASLDDIVRLARAHRMDGMIVANTTVSRPAALLEKAGARQNGGLSGRPLFALSTRILAETFTRVEGQFPLIGVGGIDSVDTAMLKFKAGATLIQLYSGLVFQGLGLLSDIKQHLNRQVEGGLDLSREVGRDAHALARTSLDA